MCQRFQFAPRFDPVGFTFCFALLLTATVPTGLLAQQPSATADAPPTTWTSNKGLEVEADFVRMTDDAVVLKMKRDGKEASVPLTSLSIDSIYQATRLAHPEEFSKPVPKAEIKKKETLELPQLNLNVNEMLRSPFTPGTTIEQFLQTADRLPLEGNFFSGWHALPPKMQTDIEDIIVKGHQVLGPGTIKQMQILLTDLHTILRDKREFILNLPEITANSQMAAMLEKNLPLVSSLVGGLAMEDHWQPSNFQKGNVTRWLAQLNVDVGPALLAIRQVVNENAPPGMPNPLAPKTFNIISQTADSAEVELTVAGGQPVKSSFEKVGNIWINIPEMNALRVSLDEAKAKLATGAPQEVGMIKASLGSIIAAAGGLARAKTQEEFNEAVGLLKTISGGLNQSLGLSAPKGPGG